VVGADITSAGTLIASVTDPTGGGNHDLEVLRDGDMPPVGSEDSLRQYDTYTSDETRTEAWFGYTFSKSNTFVRVVFQNGMGFPNGGWFESIRVQVRNGQVWSDVDGMLVTPSYPGDAVEDFTVYKFDFTPVRGDAIRVFGTPGGSAKFVSCAELRVMKEG